jgi:hypothetical protein
VGFLRVDSLKLTRWDSPQQLTLEGKIRTFRPAEIFVHVWDNEWNLVDMFSSQEQTFEFSRLESYSLSKLYVQIEAWDEDMLIQYWPTISGYQILVG